VTEAVALGAPSPAPALRQPWRALRDRASTVLPGAYAWVTTVAQPATQHGASAFARLSAFCALVALLSAPLFIDDRPALGRALGVYAFIGLSLSTWAQLGGSLLQHRPDPLLSALGSVAFMLYALGWGSLRHRDNVPEDGPNVLVGPPLEPRIRPARLAPAILGLIVCSALVPTFLAFRVEDPERALFAHSVGVLAAVVVITSGSRVLLNLGQRRAPPAPLARLNAAALPLALLALSFGLGFLWLVMR
jgi:hypothetical protein